MRLCALLSILHHPPTLTETKEIILLMKINNSVLANGRGVATPLLTSILRDTFFLRIL